MFDFAVNIHLQKPSQHHPANTSQHFKRIFEGIIILFPFMQTIFYV